jgi:hypothetical protein
MWDSYMPTLSQKQRRLQYCQASYNFSGLEKYRRLVELSGFLGAWVPGTGQLPNTASVRKSTEDSSPTKIQGLTRAPRPSVPGRNTHRTHTSVRSDSQFYTSRCASI